MIKKYFYQLLIFFFMTIILFIFYNKLPKIKKNSDLKQYKLIENNPEVTVKDVQDNLITKLNYFSKDLNNNSYNISADYGIMINNSEKIEMTKPTAKIILNDGNIVKITSDKALYNQQNFNSNFIGDVKVEFDNMTITANKMDLDFIENNIKIYENVIYKDIFRTLLSDNLNLDLITKNISISSDNYKKVNLNILY